MNFRCDSSFLSNHKAKALFSVCGLKLFPTSPDPSLGIRQTCDSSQLYYVFSWTFSNIVLESMALCRCLFLSLQGNTPYTSDNTKHCLCLSAQAQQKLWSNPSMLFDFKQMLVPVYWMRNNLRCFLKPRSLKCNPDEWISSS